MKMTKIAFWKMYLLFNDADRFCNSLSCKNQCPYYKNCDDIVLDKLNAEAYIKRHEGKSKKKVNVDTVKSNLKGDEHIVPNPYPTPLEVAKMIRDNGYKCTQSNLVCVGFCPIRKNKFQTCGCANENDPIMFNIRKTLIDSYIAEHEKVEPIIEPIKFDDPVPEYVYKVGESIIRIKIDVACREKTKKGEVLDYFVDDNGHSIDMKNCYKTLDEAVAVAKGKWNIK